MSAPWAFCPLLEPFAPATWLLSEDESRHASASRRLRVGDAITVFNGRGLVGEGTVAAEEAGGALRVSVSSTHSPPTPRLVIEIASALPKGDRLATLLEAIGPFAAARFTPLTCERSVVAWSPAMESRAMRVLVAACKQSRQPSLPVLAPKATVSEAAALLASRCSHLVVAHPGGGSILDVLRPIGQEAPARLAILIGPEGGFSEGEIAAATSHGARAVSLGAAVLRIELAVAAALAACRMGEWSVSGSNR